MMELNANIRNHWLWQEKKFNKIQALIDLGLMSFEDTFFLRSKIYNLPKGQLVISEPELEKRWGWSRTKIRSFLKLLEEDSLIRIERQRVMTKITILNNPFILINPQEKMQESVKQKIQYKKQTDSPENKGKAEVQEQKKKQAEIQQKNNENNIEKTTKRPIMKQKTLFEAIGEKNYENKKQTQ